MRILEFEFLSRIMASMQSMTGCRRTAASLEDKLRSLAPILAIGATALLRSRILNRQLREGRRREGRNELPQSRGELDDA